jgi:hypothetical protein
VTVANVKTFSKMYKDKAVVFNKEGQYFPVKVMNEQPIWIMLRDYKKEDYYMKYNTLQFGIDKISINDEYI